MSLFTVHPQVTRLLSLPRVEQRTLPWYAMRKEMYVTASDVASAIGKNHYKSATELLLEKTNQIPPFTGNAATRYGQKHENTAIRRYQERTGKVVYSFGLLQHPAYKWIGGKQPAYVMATNRRHGGSPDGITADGILLEIKVVSSF